MIYRVEVTVTAAADAVKAFRWKVHHSAESAVRWYTGLEKAIARLSRFPERHPIAEDESEWLGITLRQMIYGKKPGTYRLLFFNRGGHGRFALHPAQCSRPHRIRRRRVVRLRCQVLSGFRPYTTSYAALPLSPSNRVIPRSKLLRECHRKLVGAFQAELQERVVEVGGVVVVVLV